MNKKEVKRCPKCGKILSEFAEYSDNGGGLRIGLTRYYCENCKRTYDEEDIMKTITKEVLPVKLLEKKIREEMLGLGISSDKAADKARQIVNEVRSGKLGGWP